MERAAQLPRSAVLAAAPHGVSHKLLDALLTRAAAAGAKPTVVDISADFRYATWTSTRGSTGTRMARPPVHANSPAPCRSTSTARRRRMSRIPAASARRRCLPPCRCSQLDLVEPQIYVSAITGSTGAGRSPIAGTHHPQRHSDLYSYNALTHRHGAEITALARAASGKDGHFAFVPHSGPFARGIHATVQARLKKPLDTAAPSRRCAAFTPTALSCAFWTTRRG